MQLRQIRHFMSAVDHGSITQASIDQNVTQPALTRSIQKLEESLKVTLLDRGRAGVALTPYGEAFAEHARVILTGTSHAAADLTAMREGQMGHVRLALGACAVQERVASALNDVCALRPDLSMSLDYGDLAPLLGKLRRGEIDAVIDISRDGLDHTGLTVHEIGSVPMVIAARGGHRLAGRKGVTRAELAEMDWAIYDVPGADSFYCRLLDIAPQESPVRIRSAVPGMLRLLTLKSDMLSLMARSDIVGDLQRGDLVEIDCDVALACSRLRIVTRSRAYVTAALRFTISQLVQAMAQA